MKRTHSFYLKDQELLDELKRLFAIYAENSRKYCVDASSQGKESVNNIFSRQLPKNKSYSLSAASDFRVATGSLVYNEGPSYVTESKRDLGMLSSARSDRFLLSVYEKRVKNAIRAKTLAVKKRRVQLTQKNEITRKSLEQQEGVMYQANIGLELDLLNSCYSFNSTIPPSSCTLVFFDLETSGRDRKYCEILQIAAQAGDNSFLVYVQPQNPIPDEASSVNNIEIIAGVLCYNKQPVPCLSIVTALQAFLAFLEKLQLPCLLVAHNATFDADIILRYIRKESMIQDFSKIIYGFVDTLQIFRKVLLNRSGQGPYKLSTLANDFLPPSNNGAFHEGLYDCKVLQALVEDKVETKFLYQNVSLYKDRMERIITGLKKTKSSKKGGEKKVCLIKELKDVITDYMNRKLVVDGISYEMLFNACKNLEGQDSKVLLCQNQEKPVTKDKKVLQKIIEHFKIKNKEITM